MGNNVSTVGMLLVNQSLPEELRSDNLRIDKKSITKLLDQVALKHPDKYPEVLGTLTRLGASIASDTGASISGFGLADYPERQALAKELQDKIQVLRGTIKDDKQFEDEVVRLGAEYHKKFQEAAMANGAATNEPLHEQVISGARGNQMQYSSIRGADVIVSDHMGNAVPIAITNNYSTGLTPAEYFASLYGTRKGLIDTKFAVGEAGFFAKKLANSLHRMVVTDEEPMKTRLPVGLPRETSDPDIIGSILARDVGEIKAKTVITPKVAEQLSGLTKKVLTYSPITSIAQNGGVDRLSAGIRERGSSPLIGDNVGLSSAQAISEPMSQGMLNSKHSAGVGGSKISRGGFEYINNLVEAPTSFQQAGPLAQLDGYVDKVEAAPQGGHYVFINKVSHYVPAHLNVTVKSGAKLEEGDDISDGIPHPQELVKLRGIGEARRTYYKLMKEALDNSGINTSPRNIETAVAGLINHMTVTDPRGFGDYIVDDEINYNRNFANYKPREGSELLATKRAFGKYLEEPALHYTVGTRVNNKVAKELEEFNIKDVTVHSDKPKFQPFMQRALLALDADEDWETRLSGFYTGRGFQDSLARGAISDSKSTSFMPAVANPMNLGKDTKTTGKY
jgi:DNA-directed RNA polymerase subunit beta'